VRMIGAKASKRKTLAHPRIAYAIGRLERAVRQRLAEVTRRYGLTVAQYTALSVLHARGELSNAQLARRSFVTPQAMNEIVKALATAAIIAQRPHALHGRIVQIRITQKGERALARCDDAVQKVEQRMLARLSPPERGRLRKLIWACIEGLERRH
jgi:DNA-binding MarR family transcriptional regulator